MPRWCNLFLTIALIINCIIVVSGIVFLFFAANISDVYVASISAASALFNSVGLTLIMRWHRSGVPFILVATLVSGIVWSCTYADWLTSRFGNIGVFLPYIMMALYFCLLWALLFQTVNGKTVWQQSDTGMDVSHFRHIYQLSACVLLLIVGISVFVMPHHPVLDSAGNEIVETASSEILWSRLSSPDVTIEEVLSFERDYNERTPMPNRDRRITNRIFALKHLLLGGLMPDVHSRDNIMNICVIHVGAFSEQQQEIIDWYLSLDISYQSRWDECDKVNTLSEFKETIQNIIQ